MKRTLLENLDVEPIFGSKLSSLDKEEFIGMVVELLDKKQQYWMLFNRMANNPFKIRDFFDSLPAKSFTEPERDYIDNLTENGVMKLYNEVRDAYNKKLEDEHLTEGEGETEEFSTADKINLIKKVVDLTDNNDTIYTRYQESNSPSRSFDFFNSLPAKLFTQQERNYISNLTPRSSINLLDDVSRARAASENGDMYSDMPGKEDPFWSSLAEEDKTICESCGNMVCECGGSNMHEASEESPDAKTEQEIYELVETFFNNKPKRYSYLQQADEKFGTQIVKELIFTYLISSFTPSQYAYLHNMQYADFTKLFKDLMLSAPKIQNPWNVAKQIWTSESKEIKSSFGPKFFKLTQQTLFESSPPGMEKEVEETKEALIKKGYNKGKAASIAFGKAWNAYKKKKK